MAPENEKYVQDIEKSIDEIGNKFSMVRDTMDAGFAKLFKDGGFSGLQDFLDFQSRPLSYMGEGMDLLLSQEFYTVNNFGKKDHLTLTQLVGIPLPQFSYLSESEMKTIGIEVVSNSDKEGISPEYLFNVLVNNSKYSLAYENINNGKYCIHFLLQADVDKGDKGFEYVERLHMYEINKNKEVSKEGSVK